jgi:hypothetical protein
MWIIPLIIQAKRQIKRVLSLISFSNGGLVDGNGDAIAPFQTTWATLQTLGSGDVADGAAAYVYDKQCLFIWNDLAARWFLVGGRLEFDDFATALIPSAKWEGLECWIKSGVGIGGAHMIIRKIGSDYLWRYKSGRAVIDSINADILFTPTGANYTNETVVRTFVIPINNLKSIMQIGDFFEIRSVVARTASATTFTRSFRLGTGGTVSDTFIEGVTTATGQLTSGEFNIIRRNASDKVRAAGAQSANKWAGTSGSAPNAEVTVTSLDSATSYLHLTLDQSANTNESVALIDFQLHLVHAGG